MCKWIKKGCTCSNRPSNAHYEKFKQYFDFPDQAMIESWNGVIYTLAGVEKDYYRHFCNFILSNGAKFNQQRGYPEKVLMMPANAYMKTRSLRTYYDRDY